MNKELREVLSALHEACARVARLSGRMSWESVRDDEVHELALAKAIELVGEMAYQLRGGFPDFVAAHPDIPFVEAATMRHRLVHSYDTLDPRRLWLTATTSVPKLRRQLEPILIDVGEPLS
ncbi:HepT-like ribonuclease domain-containing protein [Aurantimonas sp. 22II-16-19i]|uniref:HepT-like ribonuclease domain-containing protein n=1 Tax=Aurantimonas sp. 22II-16-19i TaxID=1317114 RepID=UPI0009F7EA5D|nr:HepT-like ribonuclease domain-containing protein [Aurantimonas sp. 22II-16-19i]ORE98729.1 hypothetical protein ATO4_00145 [Aurantimonas sp. 22II-16-19i]